MDNTNLASVFINVLVMATTTFEAQRPLPETYNNQCYLVETIECLEQYRPNNSLKRP